MKAYRAYFDFTDVLKDLNSASSRSMLSFENGTTRIQKVYNGKDTGKVYSISGRYMGENVDMKSLPKGVYIVDGIKIVNE